MSTARRIAPIPGLVLLLLGAAPGTARADDELPPPAQRYYRVVVDRFANGDPTDDAGGDPADAAARHGGDLRGIIDHLDYIRGLGTTTIWLAPPPLGGDPGGSGNPWIIPQLGTSDALADLTEQAGDLGMRVVLNGPPALDARFPALVLAAANGGPTTQLADMFAADDELGGIGSGADQQATTLGGPEVGRIGHLVSGTTEQERLQRTMFAHALLYTLRGQPVLYYGDEQGFTGDGAGQGAWQDMFASRVATYNDDLVLGGPEGSLDRYDTASLLYRHVAGLALLRAEHPALSTGTQLTRYSSRSPGILAVSRVDRDALVEYLVVANTASSAQSASFTTATARGAFESILGGGPDLVPDPQGTVAVAVPPLTVRAYRATQAMAEPAAAPAGSFMSPQPGGVVGGRAEIRVAVPQTTPVEVELAQRTTGDVDWQPLVVDRTAPYRAFHDVTGLPMGTVIEYRAIIRDLQGARTRLRRAATVGEPPAPATPVTGDVTQPTAVSVTGGRDDGPRCPDQADPGCWGAPLTLDVDGIWKGSLTLPAGPSSFSVAVDGDDARDDAATAGGPSPIAVTVPTDGTRVTFYYDHRTRYASSSVSHPVAVASGDFQSELGCPTDWDPTCMRSWLQDPDGDGTLTLATTQVPPGSHSVTVAVVDPRDAAPPATAPGAAPIAFTVEAAGSTTTFSWDAASREASVAVSPPPVVPDLSTPAARWLDERTVAYPVSRLAPGVDPSWLRYRLHWGTVAVDATSAGGQSVLLERDAAAQDDHLVLRLPDWAPARVDITAQPAAAIATYTDDDVLLDATGVLDPPSAPTPPVGSPAPA